MIEIELNKKNLSLLIENMRAEDKLELIDFYGDYYQEKFIKDCLKLNDASFLADDFGNPIGIGGLYKFQYNNKNLGQLWMICTNLVNLHKISFCRYVIKKIAQFEIQCDFLFNFVFKSNYLILNLLQKLNFCVIATTNDDYKMFYKNLGDTDFDLRYFAG